MGILLVCVDRTTRQILRIVNVQLGHFEADSRASETGQWCSVHGEIDVVPFRVSGKQDIPISLLGLFGHAAA